MVGLLGSRDELLRVIEREFMADIHVRGNEITVTGRPEETALVSGLFEEMLELQANGAELSADAVERAAGMLRRERGVRPAEVLTLDILSSRGRTIRPKTLNQKRYVDAIDQHTIVFGIGPAGTGKTYLAMAKAVQALQAKEVNRIILTRPAVEAGERLGFLPGTLYEKIDPYLRPLYDALHDMLDPDSIPRLTAAGTIEVAPLAYMRGRTLNDAFIILDEAQNTSAEQMKMFLTRLGFGSKMVVTGDVTQVDLPERAGQRPAGGPGHPRGVDDIHFCPADQPRRRPAPAGRRDRRRLRALRRPPARRRRGGAAGPAGAAHAPQGGSAVSDRAYLVSIDIANESGVEVDEVALAALARFVLDEMRIHPLAELSVLLVDEKAMTELHEQWMGEPGPTDVLAFPMDELRPPHLGGVNAAGPEPRSRAPTRACSATSCCARRWPRPRPGRPARAPRHELELLAVHGILHLLGYDHAEPEEKRGDVRPAGPAAQAGREAGRFGVMSAQGWLVAAAIVLVLIAGLVGQRRSHPGPAVGGGRGAARSAPAARRRSGCRPSSPTCPAT